MSFLSPIALVFAATLPVVVVFYLLKRKRVVKLVSSTLLWQKFLAETQASAPFQRLRHNWLLVLQLVLLALAVLALARPFLTGDARHTRLSVVILDGSASMQSTDESPSRFERARSEALRMVDSLSGNEQMLVLLAGVTTEVKQSPTSDKAALRRALVSCSPGDTPTRLAEALRIASAFTFEKRGEEEVAFGEIHLFSDGVAADLDELANENLPLVYHRVGQRGANAGVVTLDVRAHPEDPTRRALFAGVLNASSNRMPAQVELWFGEQLVETRSIDLPPRTTEPLVFSVTQEQDGIFALRLQVEDDLDVDNEASVVSQLPLPAKVLLVTRGNRFLEKALAAAPSVTLTVAADLADTASEFDFVVVDDVLPTTWPAGNVLAIRSAPTNWVEVTGALEAPPIVDWKNTHPLLRFVGFENVQVSQALATQTPSWAVGLVEAPNAPLVLAGELERRRVIWIAFDTLQSTWPLRISFPIFMANAVEWLNPARTRSAELLVRTGDAIRVPLPEEPTATAVVRLPDGTQRELAIDATAREVVFGDTLRRGIYEITVSTNQTVVCVNLLDAAESATTPRDVLKLGEYAQVQAAAAQLGNREIWRYLAGGALALLLFEWWYYHKRTV